MEEDIKIVEELIEHNYLEDVNYLREDNDYVKFNQALENLLKAYKQDEKMIDLMAEQLTGLTIFDNDIEEPLILGDKEEVKEYFRKKVGSNE